MRHAIAVSGRNPVAARLLTVLLIVGGLFAASRLEMTVHPEIDHREIRVTVHSPGASPDEVEREINRRLEERLLQMDGIRSVTAEAREGMALVTAGIGWFVSRYEMLENVRAAVARLEGFPPAFAERPRIELTDNADSVANAAITLAVRSASPVRRCAAAGGAAGSRGFAGAGAGYPGFAAPRSRPRDHHRGGRGNAARTRPHDRRRCGGGSALDGDGSSWRTAHRVPGALCCVPTGCARRERISATSS